MIGAGIGTMESGALPLGIDLPYQFADIRGYIQNAGANIPQVGNMDIRMVEGDDIRIKLEVIGYDNQEINYDLVEQAFWELLDENADTVLSFSMSDGIIVDDKIRLVLEEADTDGLHGLYTYDFSLKLSGNSTATVIKDKTELPAFLFIRKKKTVIEEGNPMSRAAPYVQQTTNTAGTGNLLLAPVAKRRSFQQAFPDSSISNPFYYMIFDEATFDYEAGRGYLDGQQLVRLEIVESSNDGDAVDFQNGRKIVSCDIPATLQATAITTPIDA